MFERCPELVITVLAVFKAGLVLVPVSASWPKNRLEIISKDAEAKAILYHECPALDLPIQGFDYQTICSTLLSLDSSNPDYPVNLEDPAYIIYTSGSTGTSKGVLVGYAGIANLVQWYSQFFHFSPEDQVSQINIPCFDVYFVDLLPALAAGASIHIPSEAIKKDPFQLMHWLIDKKITVCDLPTAYGEIILDMDWPTQGNLRIFKMGGESLGKFPSRAYGFEIYNAYGPTETTIDALYARIYSPHLPVNPGHWLFRPLANP